MQKLGKIKLVTSFGTETFEIQAVSLQHYTEASGQVMVKGTPICCVEMEKPSKFSEYELTDGQVERAQLAYDSFIENKGVYNSYPLDANDELEHTFSEDLLQFADADFYDFLGKKHMFVENKSSSSVKFRFNIWDLELAKKVYDIVIKPRQVNPHKTFHDYTGVNI